MKKNKSNNILRKKKEGFCLFLEKTPKNRENTKKIISLKTEIKNLMKNKNYKKNFLKKIGDLNKPCNIKNLEIKRKSKDKYTSSRIRENTKKYKSKKKSIIKTNNKNLFNFKLLKKKSTSIKKLIERGLLGENPITKHLQENLENIFYSRKKNKKNSFLKNKKIDSKKPAKKSILKKTKNKSKSISSLKKKKKFEIFKKHKTFKKIQKNKKRKNKNRNRNKKIQPNNLNLIRKKPLKYLTNKKKKKWQKVSKSPLHRKNKKNPKKKPKKIRKKKKRKNRPKKFHSQKS